MKMYFKFHQNHTINEEFGFLGVKEAGGWGVPRFKKNIKSLLQNGGLNPHQKFQNSGPIRKCLKISGTDSTSGGLKPHRQG